MIVTVEDEGPGVAADQREQIFDRFHSIRPSEEEFGRHSGLGGAASTASTRASSVSSTAAYTRSPSWKIVLRRGTVPRRWVLAEHPRWHDELPPVDGGPSEEPPKG